MNNALNRPFFLHIHEAASSLFDQPVEHPIHHVFFAATVSSVPDLSSYQEFQQVELLEQVQRVLETQRLLLLGLAQGAIQSEVRRAVDLRYIRGYERQITLALLGKCCALSAEQAEREAHQFWQDIEKLFPRYLYRGGLVAVTDPDALAMIREPFSEGQQVVAIQKRIDQTHLLRLDGGHPLPYPLRWGISTMRDVCKTMLQMDQPCYLSSALAPTYLTTSERLALNSITSRLKKLAEGRDRSRRMGIASSLASGAIQASLQNQSGQQDRESFLPDPQAQINYEIYESYLRQLDHPLLWRCYIVGQGSIPSSMIGAWYGEIIGLRSHDSNTNDSQPGSMAHLPAEKLMFGNARQQALDNLRLLEFTSHGAENAMQVPHGELHADYQQLVRLPRLVDVQEASCIFKLPCLPYRDEIGLPINSGAFITLAQPASEQPCVEIGQREDRTRHRVVLEDLTRHTLVAGTTGSGKTTTCLNLLQTLLQSDPPVPFLVIEPVNAEHNDYRTLINLSPHTPVHLFTLGDEQTAPFRLNPFVIAPGITVREHISSLLQCFKAALPMWEPLPRVFLKALNRTYYRAGWPANRKATLQSDRFPTIYDFYAELSQVVDHEIEHSGEIQGNIRGATKLRVESLLEGSCGRVLAARASLPPHIWLEQPTILELRHIGDDEDKALMVAFILLALREYCETRPRQQGLQHITLIEEAHRLLGQAPEGTSDEVSNTRGQAAAAFANMLAETRKYGEGLIIAEQLPTKLVPDVIGNTGLKIMHRLVSQDDREVLGRAMRFHPFQEEHVATLKPGEAAVYSQDQEEPVLVHVDGKDWNQRRLQAPTNEEIRLRVQAECQSVNLAFLPFDGCAHCPRPCAFRDHGEALTFDKSVGYEKRMLKCFEQFDLDKDLPENDEDIMRPLVQTSIHMAREVTHIPDTQQLELAGIAYCAFLHLKATSQHFRKSPARWDTLFREIQMERGGR